MDYPLSADFDSALLHWGDDDDDSLDCGVDDMTKSSGMQSYAGETQTHNTNDESSRHLQPHQLPNNQQHPPKEVLGSTANYYTTSSAGQQQMPSDVSTGLPQALATTTGGLGPLNMLISPHIANSWYPVPQQQQQQQQQQQHQALTSQQQHQQQQQQHQNPAPPKPFFNQTLYLSHPAHLPNDNSNPNPNIPTNPNPNLTHNTTTAINSLPLHQQNTIYPSPAMTTTTTPTFHPSYTNPLLNPTTPPAPPPHPTPPPSTLPHPPPFYLFAPPIELRHNFLQSARLHNLPPHPDPNSYHYGLTINGFHPRLNAIENPIPVTLIDARHERTTKGKERNEREQRRAQKITEMIEKLRLSMVKGGWKVEMKSKYHTLNKCAEYVRHLIKITSEKELLVKKAKSDLQNHERQLEDHLLSENRSDPESVVSSLTASTMQSGKRCLGTGGERVVGGRKKVRVEGYSSNDEEGVSVSDVTESRGGDTATTGGKRGGDRREEGERGRHKGTEVDRVNSMDANFKLDYEEVFLTSNIPQIIATPSGQIVTWNKFFLAATGLTENEVKRLTIFSIVKASKLSSLFQIVSTALRSPCPPLSPRLSNYAAVTLPCVSFPSNNSSHDPHSKCLYMTVTLMNDVDESKRCFHCVFTDFPAVGEERIGSVTPELLKRLFWGPEPRRERGGGEEDKGDGVPEGDEEGVGGGTIPSAVSSHSSSRHNITVGEDDDGPTESDGRRQQQRQFTATPQQKMTVPNETIGQRIGSEVTVSVKDITATMI